VKDVVNEDEDNVMNVRAIVLGLAADSGAPNAELALADRIIVLNYKGTRKERW
jgi:hypothetical protein